jgi:hypothetical protein
MRYLAFLQQLHALLADPPYLEIGIRHGDSLALARSRAVGVDPGFTLKTELSAGVTLFEETSDEFFDRPAPLEPLGGDRVGLSFIDGMHLAEFVLRDFINVERHAVWSSVIVFDDILPRTVDEAARYRQTRAWTGDVYKILGTLARHRPDLIVLRVNTEPTGLGVVLGLDPNSRVLAEHYDEIVREMVVPDPQAVPDDILERHGIVEPEAVLSASFWPMLAAARAHGNHGRRRGVRKLRRTIERELGVSARPLERAIPAPA